MAVRPSTPELPQTTMQVSVFKVKVEELHRLQGRIDEVQEEARDMVRAGRGLGARETQTSARTPGCRAPVPIPFPPRTGATPSLP